uniref:Molybdopterin dehydrogenase FAD-binding domain-containing protein n=1 Tax=Arsenophonus endosymbiont of Trialeurodes vaporariorum TaxID=235567 RepID=A0A3B0LYD6_9GAMM
MYGIKNYHRADNIAHAVALLAQNSTARLLADGTDVLIQLHHLNSHFDHIIDIHYLPALLGIRVIFVSHRVRLSMN